METTTATTTVEGYGFGIMPILIILVLVVIPYWKIWSRTGHSGAWGAADAGADRQPDLALGAGVQEVAGGGST